MTTSELAGVVGGWGLCLLSVTMQGDGIVSTRWCSWITKSSLQLWPVVLCPVVICPLRFLVKLRAGSSSPWAERKDVLAALCPSLFFLFLPPSSSSLLSSHSLFSLLPVVSVTLSVGWKASYISVLHVWLAITFPLFATMLLFLLSFLFTLYFLYIFL